MVSGDLKYLINKYTEICDLYQLVEQLKAKALIKPSRTINASVLADKFDLGVLFIKDKKERNNMLKRIFSKGGVLIHPSHRPIIEHLHKWIDDTLSMEAPSEGSYQKTELS